MNPEIIELQANPTIISLRFKNLNKNYGQLIENKKNQQKALNKPNFITSISLIK